MISVEKRAVVGRIEVPAQTLKTIVLDAKNDRLYVTMRDKNQVAVIDLEKCTCRNSELQLHVDSAMAFDAVHHRLFVGDRKPGKLIVLNTEDGSVVATLPLGDTSDDMSYDAGAWAAVCVERGWRGCDWAGLAKHVSVTAACGHDGWEDVDLCAVAQSLLCGAHKGRKGARGRTSHLRGAVVRRSNHTECRRGFVISSTTMAP